MALQFNKDRVIERLKKHLTQAERDEVTALAKHQDVLADWEASIDEWREEAISYYTDWVNAQGNSEMVTTNIHNAPSPPQKPKEPRLNDVAHIQQYIGQVECLDGKVVTLSKGLLDGVGRYLS